MVLADCWYNPNASRHHPVDQYFSFVNGVIDTGLLPRIWVIEDILLLADISQYSNAP